MIAYQCFIDGATCGPQPCSTIGYSVIIKKTNKTVIELIGKEEGRDLSSAYAETKALETLLDLIEEKAYTNCKVMIFCDYEVLVDQINNSYPALPNVEVCRKKFESLKKVVHLGMKWVPREQNKEADKLSKKALKI